MENPHPLHRQTERVSGDFRADGFQALPADAAQDHLALTTLEFDLACRPTEHAAADHTQRASQRKICNRTLSGRLLKSPQNSD
jgi:hypothetical protein